MIRKTAEMLARRHTDREIDLIVEGLKASPMARSLCFEKPLDFGVAIPKPARWKSMTDRDVVDLIGKEESARLNFTSMIIEGIAMEEISEWINLCRRRKIKEYRRWTKPMQEAIDAYAATVIEYWGDRLDVYQYYFDETLRESARLREVVWRMGVSNEIARQFHPRRVDMDATLALAFTVLMLRRAEAVDREKLDRLSRASGGRIVRREPDPNVRKMIAACVEMQKALGLEVEATRPVSDTIGAFHTKISVYCSDLLRQEVGERAG